MKRSLALGALTLMAALFVPALSSAHCSPGNDTGASGHDRFGSCETSNGDVRCSANATDVGGLFNVATPGTGNGVQICNEGGNVPIVGRATLYTDGSSVTVGIDGDKDNPGSSGWSRVDAGSDGCLRLRRGSAGTYWTASGGTSNADVADQEQCA